MTGAPSIGFVAIGRNEGERFERCLLSLKKEASRIVYVDSGSVDGSVAFAKGEGVEVIELDRDAPFTAARARNAGFDALSRVWPDTDYVMFIDGDCAVAPGFAGEAAIFMVRADSFSAVGGFNPTVIAAEDDDFCIRLRGTGAKIVRLGRDMCFHDADIHRFGQWWRRMVRAGHAFAQVGELHPGYFAAERRRAWLWGLFLPLAALIAAPFTYGLSLALLLLYPVSLWKTRRGLIARGAAPEHATLAAKFLTLSKFPNVIGMLNYKRKKLTGRHIGIVEYK